MSAPTRTPHDIRTVSQAVAGGVPYSFAVKELLDRVAVHALQRHAPGSGLVAVPPSVFEDEPVPLAEPVHRAHLAGLAEYLANLAGVAPPAWCLRPEFVLPEPVFLGGRHSREHVRKDTPGPFRRRNLFCGPVLTKLRMVLAERETGQGGGRDEN